MKKSSLYSPHPAFAMEAAGLRLPRERTGRTLKQGVARVPKQGPRATKERIAQLKPSTKTRLDLGLALGDTRAVAPLIDTGGFLKKDRITHRIAIAAPADIDETVARWLHVAYDRDAP